MARRKMQEVVAQPEPEEKQQPKLIRVVSPDGAPFWERHPEHPGGEVWVAGNDGGPSKPVEVARTMAVERALKEGRLVVESPPAPLIKGGVGGVHDA